MKHLYLKKKKLRETRQTSFTFKRSGHTASYTFILTFWILRSTWIITKVHFLPHNKRTPSRL